MNDEANARLEETLALSDADMEEAAGINGSSGAYESAPRPTPRTAVGIDEQTIVCPLFDRVALRELDPDEMESESRSVLFIPDQAKEKPQLAEVLAIGPGKYESGVFVATTVKVGQIVLIGKYVGTEVNVKGRLVRIVRELDCLAVIEDPRGQQVEHLNLEGSK